MSQDKSNSINENDVVMSEDTESNENSPTFLTTLCFAELENILLLMSSDSSRVSWARGMKDSDLYHSLHPSSPFLHPCRMLLSGYPSEARKFEIAASLLRASDLLTHVTLDFALVEKLEACNMVRYFSEVSVNVSSVRFDNLKKKDVSKWRVYRDILHEWRADIREVRLDGDFRRWMTRNLMDTCVELRKLTLRCTFMSAAATDAFWAKIGPKLTELTILYASNALLGNRPEEAEEIRNIQRFCRGLEYVFIIAPISCDEVLANCIASYGRQMGYALINMLSAQQAKLIYEKCPNVRVIAKLEAPSATEIIDCYGERVDVLLPYNNEAYLDDASTQELDEMTQAFDKCSAVQRFYCVHFNLIRPFFSRPKPDLLEFDLQIGSGFFSADLMRAVIKATGALQSVALRRIPPMNLGLIIDLLEANPQLTEVVFDIGNMPEMDVTQFSLSDITKFCLNLTSAMSRFEDIKSIEISFLDGVSKWLPRFDDACLRLRYQKRQVIVNGIQYIPRIESNRT